MNCFQLPGTPEIAVSSLWRAKLFHHHCNLVVSRTFSNFKSSSACVWKSLCSSNMTKKFYFWLPWRSSEPDKIQWPEISFYVYYKYIRSILSKRCQYGSQILSLTFDAHLNFKNCRPQESTSLCWDQRIHEQNRKTLDLCASCRVSCLAKAPMTLTFLNCM